MKKTLLILAAVVIAGACTKNTYVDGTYTAKFNEPSHDYTGYLDVTLVDDEISALDYDYMNDTVDLLKSEDEAYKQRMLGAGRETSPDVFIPQIEAALMNATIVPEFDSIDVVSGATGSSGDANYLMHHALDLAKTGEQDLIEVGYPEE
jgi:major membrane immunogen (membrane-anchored lipoprotein)